MTLNVKFNLLLPLSLASVVAAFVFTACNDQSDQRLQKGLAGTWTLELTYPEGGNFKSVTQVSPAGSYSSEIAVTRASNTIQISKMEGTWRVKNGVLIDTNTKNSNTNALPLPRVVWRVRIVRLNSRELALARDGTNDWGSPFDQVTFRKTGK